MIEKFMFIRGGDFARSADDIRAMFDSEFYLAQLDSGVECPDPVTHYLQLGFLCGKDPAPWFSTEYYFLLYPDIKNSGMNPFAHYLETGKFEGRVIVRSGTPLVDSPAFLENLLIIKGHLDEDFYLNKYPDVLQANIDPVFHYIYYGAAEGRDPAPWFNTQKYLSSYNDVLVAKVNPFYHYLAQGRKENRKSGIASPAADEVQIENTAILTEDEESIIRTEMEADFDADFYFAKYPELNERDTDPILDYIRDGAMQLRDPCPQFSTKYYLYANPDVREAGINPFFHYIIAGREEGRLPKFPGGYKSERLQDVMSPQQVSQLWHIGNRPIKLGLSQELRNILLAKAGEKVGVVFSFSHDSYSQNVGGVQLCISLENIEAQKEKKLHINLSPTIPAQMLMEKSEIQTFLLAITIDGVMVGNFRYTDIFQIIKENKWLTNDSDLIIHALHGHSTKLILNLWKLLSPRRNLFWIHDFFSICEGYNLLRNGITECAGPAQTSNACKICVYGATRSEHLRSMATLFQTIPFDVVAPSEFAAQKWINSNRGILEYQSISVVPHARVIGSKQIFKNKASIARIAYLGYPSFHKGWPIFLESVDKYSHINSAKFYIFGSTNPGDPRIEFVETNVANSCIDAMRENLKIHNIDYAFLGSQCPETFGFTAVEAAAAGVSILTFNTSGNISHFVAENKVGHIFNNTEEYLEFLSNILNSRPTKMLTNMINTEFSRFSFEVLA